MYYTVEEALKYMEEEDAKFIRLAFRDAFGVQKNISVMTGEVRKAFEYGAPINAREIAGFEDCPYASLFLKPDPSTLAVLPWRPDSGRVFRMYCDVCAPDGTVYPADTREILKQAVRKAQEAGIEFRFGTEAEFYLFRKDEEGNPTRIPYDEAGYLDIAPLDRCENIRREICLTIERMGLTPERSHHERGPGQNEIDFHYAKPLKAADQITTFRMVVCTIADRYGLTADFSPVPLPGMPGNGYHINMYAVDRDGNDLARYAAAGILDKIREITLFLNPTTESYTRLDHDSVPNRVGWSDDKKSELLYIENYRDQTRAEFRSPDASGNPYLVYALMVQAGLRGIAEKMELPDKMPEGSCVLPGSKEEAAKLAQDSKFVNHIIPKEIIRIYAQRR